MKFVAWVGVCAVSLCWGCEASAYHALDGAHEAAALGADAAGSAAFGGGSAGYGGRSHPQPSAAPPNTAPQSPRSIPTPSAAPTPANMQPQAAGTSAPVLLPPTMGPLLPAGSEPGPQCAAPSGEVARPASLRAFLDLLVGDWHVCSASSVFCGASAWGISFRDDGTWSDFEAQGEARYGTYDVLDTTMDNGVGSYQVDIRVSDGTLITLPVLSADGSHMLLGNSGVCSGVYARAGTLTKPANKTIAGIPVEPLPPTSRDAGAYAAVCDLPASGSIHSIDVAGYETGVIGIWHNCEAGPVDAFAGFELAGDRRWYELFADEHGALWRAADWQHRGDWHVLATRNGPDLFQLNLALDSGGTLPALPIVSGDGLHLRLNTDSSVFPNDYVRVFAQLPAAPKLLHGVAVEATPRSLSNTVTCPSADLPPLAFETQPSFEAAFSGDWVACGDMPTCNGRAGLEFTADHAYYELYADSDGTLWRATQWGHSGTWSAGESSGGGPPFLLSVYTYGEGFRGLTANLAGSASQRSMTLTGDTQCEASYVQLQTR